MKKLKARSDSHQCTSHSSHSHSKNEIQPWLESHIQYFQPLQICRPRESIL